ncbi:DUF1146 family protein [Enterococcus alcedinis]|uniref:Membrane protein n=1 Tax=Enterococcus alcedinis TaxID=1274384 RepID=A0A917JFM9_9ENTE|nr:DUF1146 family protein [Enterococcus alcedinis]MBP2101306.1 putative integral membrane protein (TIGR02327 family) [Enterococcus alcedinis]GGI64394.1 membrane protein [Enterococcus alcedinis]
MQVYGIDVIIRITTHFIFIYLAFWSLKSLRLDMLFKPQNTTQIRMAIALLSIGMGYLASTFFLELMVLGKNMFSVGF